MDHYNIYYNIVEMEIIMNNNYIQFLLNKKMIKYQNEIIAFMKH